MPEPFNRGKLLVFLEKNPDKIPCMAQTLRDELRKAYELKIKTMSLSEMFMFFNSNTGLIPKSIVDNARKSNM